MMDALSSFKRVEINLPLLAELRTKPENAKLLVDYCLKKESQMNEAKVFMGENMSKIIRRKL